MAERELLITSFVRGEYLMGMCTKCKTTFMVALADDLKTAKAKALAASDVMRWRNQNGAAVFIVRSNAFFTNEILKKEPEVRLLENSLQQAD